MEFAAQAAAATTVERIAHFCDRLRLRMRVARTMTVENPDLR